MAESDGLVISHASALGILLKRLKQQKDIDERAAKVIAKDKPPAQGFTPADQETPEPLPEVEVDDEVQVLIDEIALAQDISIGAVRRLMEDELVKADGQLTQIAAAYMVANNLGVNLDKVLTGEEEEQEEAPNISSFVTEEGVKKRAIEDKWNEITYQLEEAKYLDKVEKTDLEDGFYLKPKGWIEDWGGVNDLLKQFDVVWIRDGPSSRWEWKV
jgi:hypothetical protein